MISQAARVSFIIHLLEILSNQGAKRLLRRESKLSRSSSATSTGRVMKMCRTSNSTRTWVRLRLSLVEAVGHPLMSLMKSMHLVRPLAATRKAPQISLITTTASSSIPKMDRLSVLLSNRYPTAAAAGIDSEMSWKPNRNFNLSGREDSAITSVGMLPKRVEETPIKDKA